MAETFREALKGSREKMPRSWGERSKDAIREAVTVWLDITGEMPSASMTEERKRALVRMVDKSYPFGSRDRWPYKAWLKERREFTKRLYHASLSVGLFEEEGV
jgi:hypothetical protein